jgi:hypothetical protein
MSAIFSPCRARRHELCTEAYRDDRGESVKCACSCHRVADMFRPVVSVQRDLFAARDDGGSDLDDPLNCENPDNQRNRMFR